MPYRDVGAGDLVDAVHVPVELWPVLLPVVAVARDEQQGVDHLVEQRLNQVTARPKREQWPTEANRAQARGRMVRAHSGAPADTTASRCTARSDTF